jgi:hypothetical protein
MAHIQIDSTTPRIAYTATAAQEDFTVPFAFFAEADLVVYVDDVLQTLSMHYTVTGEGESDGGTVTFVTPMTGGESVVIVRDVEISRTTDFPDTGPLQINSLNTQLDKIIAIQQQLNNDIVRTLRLADSDTSENLDIPIASERANKFLAFDADGDPFVAEAVEDQPASAFALTLLDDATRQAALVTLGVIGARRTITGADTIAASDHGGIIEATSGTFSLAATAAATLGSGFWCIVYNSGTGTVTIDPDGAELIDGAATVGMGHGVTLLVFCTGSAFETVRMGDASGPNGSVTDGHAVVFNGTGGKILKSAGAAPALLGAANADYIGLTEMAAPSAPAANNIRVYCVDNEVLAYKQSNGTEIHCRAATQAEMEAASSTAAFGSPGRQHYHPGHPKFWAYVTVSGGTPTLQTSYNVTSITDTDVGDLTVTIATDFSSDNWAVFGGPVDSAGVDTGAVHTIAAGTVRIQAKNGSFALEDPAAWSAFGLGDHA